ncbi:MAG TPA: hypothetical protein VF662_03525 [Allosphingosinicella sp.]|jgi:hypothetical protein
MNLKRLEMHDGSVAIVNADQVLWLEARDARTTRLHFSGSQSIHVRGSVADIARLLTHAL